MGSISENFSFTEFERSKTAKDAGILNAITTFEVRDAIVALVENVLQPLRSAWGAPLKVNSGYRCPKLNAMVGGEPTSQHVRGEAADIDAPHPIKLAQLLVDMRLPFDQLIIYPTFLHISHRLEGPQRKQVLYSRQYRGRKVKVHE